MARLWTPPTREHRPVVSREHREGSVAHRALVLSMMYETPITQHWEPELRKIDDLLRLRQAGERAHAPNVMPGFYHLIRLNNEGPIWVQPLTGPNGEFVELTSVLLDALRACDLQNDRAVRAREEMDRKAAMAKQRDSDPEDEARGQEARERTKALTETQVLVSPDVCWAQNVSGQKRPTRGRG